MQRIGTIAPTAAGGGRRPGEVERRLIRLVRGLPRSRRSGTADRRSAGAILSGSPLAARAADARTRSGNGGENTGGALAAAGRHFRLLAGRAPLRSGGAGQRRLL